MRYFLAGDLTHWFSANDQWLFSGGGVVILVTLVRIIADSRESRLARIRPTLRRALIKPYPDPRLKIKEPGKAIRTEYFLLFNRAMLKQNAVHAVRVMFRYFADEQHTIIATMDETFGARKDFLIIGDEDQETLFVYGEGGVDWTVWIAKRSNIGAVSVIYGSMVYYGFKNGFVGAAAILLVEVDKARYNSFEPTYFNVADFDARFPLASRILDKRNSRIVADFHDLADVNFLDLRDEIDSADRRPKPRRVARLGDGASRQ